MQLTFWHKARYWVLLLLVFLITISSHPTIVDISRVFDVLECEIHAEAQNDSRLLVYVGLYSGLLSDYFCSFWQ